MKLLKNIFGIILLTCISLNTSAGVIKSGQYSGSMGIKDYKVYLPGNGSDKNLPLVVMLHGCDQSPEEFAISSRIYQWADKEKFAVLLPDQSLLYNPFKCWNWIIPSNNSRMGEASAIIEMIEQVVTNYKVNKDRVFAAGMSAGASMAGILANCYPEHFKAIASHDGVQFYPTYSGADALSVVLNGANVPAEQSAYLGYTSSVMFSSTKRMPIIIFHGQASPLMNPLHAAQIEDEFIAFNDYIDNHVRDTSSVKDKKVETVQDSATYGYTKYSVIGEDNEPFIQRYMINHLNHSWSGGDGKYRYNDPKGPDATKLIVNFFKRFGL